MWPTVSGLFSYQFGPELKTELLVVQALLGLQASFLLAQVFSCLCYKLCNQVVVHGLSPF